VLWKGGERVKEEGRGFSKETGIEVQIESQKALIKKGDTS
jgi:hypothetical protein